MNNDLTTFEVMAAFKDESSKIQDLLFLKPYIICPITHQPIEVLFRLLSVEFHKMIMQGQIVFKASDLEKLSITYQTV